MNFADPNKNIAYLSLREGMTVADFGAGSGHYAVALGKRLAGTGHVYAIEVQKNLLSHIKDEAKRAGAQNVEVIWGSIDDIGGTTLRDQSCDAVLISNVLFQADSKENLAREAFRVLKSGGEILLIDWSGSFGMMGPHPDQVVTKERAKELFQQVGFQFDRDCTVGHHHWGAVFRK